jgi:DNA replication protein DnaC
MNQTSEIQTITHNEQHQGHCEKHGEYALKQFENKFTGEIKWLGDCPECVKEEKQAKLECQTAQRKKYLLEYSGIPERFLKYTFDDYRTDNHIGKNKALETIKQYALDFTSNKEKGRSMTILGPPGTGKTLLGCCLVKEVINKTFYGYEIDETIKREELVNHDSFAHYTTEYNLIRKIKNCWAKDSEMSEEDKIAGYCEPDLLVIDEIGISFGSEADKILLYQVINARYEKTLPTVLISNLNLKDLTAHCGERIIDRLRENSGIQLTFNWESYRR